MLSYNDQLLWLSVPFAIVLGAFYLHSCDSQRHDFTVTRISFLSFSVAYIAASDDHAEFNLIEGEGNEIKNLQKGGKNV